MHEAQANLLALCALDGVKGAQWQLIARQASTPTGLAELLDGVVSEHSATASLLRDHLRKGLQRLEAARQWVVAETERATCAGAQLVTVLDDVYPLNLRRIHNLPPFLYVLGRLDEADIRAIAVVGTRDATPTGLAQARRMATELTQHHITVVSGLATGIDTAAHEAALDAGGRTIAVMGTGILRTYPQGNEKLKDRIGAHGAVLSQFWPDQPPGRHTFPIRNAVTSGISQGSVVIEASATSGAKLQARLAVEHGRVVYVLRSLVEQQPWAKQMAAERRAVVVSDITQILDTLQTPATIREAVELREQLALELT